MNWEYIAQRAQLAVYGFVWKDAEGRCLACGQDMSSVHPMMNIYPHVIGECRRREIEELERIFIGPIEPPTFWPYG